MKVISIEFDPNHQTVQVETNGFTGTACQDATKQIEQALGAVQSDIKTPEAYIKDEKARLNL